MHWSVWFVGFNIYSFTFILGVIGEGRTHPADYGYARSFVGRVWSLSVFLFCYLSLSIFMGRGLNRRKEREMRRRIKRL